LLVAVLLRQPLRQLKLLLFLVLNHHCHYHCLDVRDVRYHLDRSRSCFKLGCLFLLAFALAFALKVLQVAVAGEVGRLCVGKLVDGVAEGEFVANFEKDGAGVSFLAFELKELYEGRGVDQVGLKDGHNSEIEWAAGYMGAAREGANSIELN
jgi:hypothetical protein